VVAAVQIPLLPGSFSQGSDPYGSAAEGLHKFRPLWGGPYRMQRGLAALWGET